MLESVHVGRPIIIRTSISVSVGARKILSLELLLLLGLVHLLLVVNVADHSRVHLSWRMLLVLES